jgi:hypothetical protein
MPDFSPTSYEGRTIASSQRLGLVKPSSADFSVAADGTMTRAAGTITTADLADDAVTSAKLAENTIQYAKVTLTSAQVKALAATQIDLVAAPGANKVVHFLGAQLVLKYGGTNAFTESTNNLAIRYTDGSGVIVSAAIETTGFIDQTADTATSSIPVGDAIVALTGAANQALVLDNTSGAEIAGNAANDNTLEVYVAYRVIDVS